MTRIEQASATFKQGFNCAQAVFTAFADQCGIDPDIACRISTGFGGGIARHGEVCGAVTGATMVISAKYGRTLSDLTKDKQSLVYEKTQKLFEEFCQQMGTVNCRALVGGIDLRTSQGQTQFIEQGLGAKVCVPCVEKAAAILESIL